MPAQRVKNFKGEQGQVEDARSLFGSALAADWRQAFIARGYGWHADEGAFSTPAAGGGAAAIIDIDRPNMLISVPAEYTLIPLRIHTAAHIPLGAADSDESEIVFAVDPSSAAAGITTQTTRVTPVNMRTTSLANATDTCPARVFITLSADITVPVLSFELGHAVKIFETKTDVSVLWTDLTLTYEPMCPPFIRGPACLYVYHGGTVATTGYTNADFLVVPSGLLTDVQ